MKFAVAGLPVIFLAPVSAMAQDEEAPDASERPPETVILEEPVAAAETDRVSVSLGATFVTEYISRGISFADDPNLQPYITVNFAIPELTGGAITDANLYVGSWSSIKLGSVDDVPGDDLKRWYEVDLYAGAAVELDDRWQLSATYYRYESPNDSYEGYNDFEFIARYDDAGQWASMPLRNFQLTPQLRMVQENARPGRKDALYIQPSVTAAFDVGAPDNPVRVAVPVMFGFSDEYYDSVDGGYEDFGFFRSGLTLSVKPFPDSAPALGLNGGFDFWALNDDVINGLADNVVVGRAGLSWGF